MKRKQLTALLAKSIFPKGFNGRYPLLNTDIHDHLLEGEVKEEKAIDVMKAAMKEMAKTKVRKIPLYKPKKKLDWNSSDQLSTKIVKRGINKKKHKTNEKRFKKSKIYEKRL